MSDRPLPLLILGDGPDLKTGLGRIGHDLAWLLSAMPEFRVGYMGRLSFGRSKFPWQNYTIGLSDQWGEERLQEAWSDLSNGERGIILTVWDASRLLWFADPTGMGKKHEDFLGPDRSFEKWMYCMVDGSGVNPTALPLEQAHVMSCYDRVLTASRFGHGLAANSVKHPDLDWMPHGINGETFKPIDPMYARSGWGLGPDDIVIGIVATNQERKHWPTMLASFAGLKDTARLWIHTDKLLAYWDINALAVEYGIGSRIICENRDLTDAELAMRYSACDATLLISGGEGFSYATAESIACGTPHVTGAYGAQAELVRPDWLVPPKTFQILTNHNVRRAVYNADEVSQTLGIVVANRRRGMYEKTVNLAEHLQWKNLAYPWRKWLKKERQ